MSRPLLIVCAGQQLFESFFGPAQKRRLGQFGRYSLVPFKKLSRAFQRDLASADALITTWDSPRFDTNLLELAPKLRMIAHCGGEVKSRFARPLFDQLTITNSADPMATATAELGAALLLYAARNVDYYRQQLRQPSNRIYGELHLRGAPESISGREVAMIGFGRIGRALVDLTRGFDLKWLVYDPYAPTSLATRYPVRFVNLRSLLPRAHLLVLTAALTEETRGLLNRVRLAQLPQNAAVINIARGGLIDMAALTNEVRKKRLRCALDVTDPLEPLPAGHPLRTMPGAIVTPHIAGSNRQVRYKMADVVLNDLERFFRGQRVKNRVTSTMLDRMT
jgi:phosphoglycerate dehydrogenase-like enzyme